MNSYSEIYQYIKSDFIRYGGKPTFFNIIISVFIPPKNSAFVYSFWLRCCQYRTMLYPFARFMHYRLSIKYGIQIPVTTQIGYGLYLGHGIGVVVNSTAVIGNNCNLSQFTTIGSNHDKAAIIGDNVYIGPSVCIVENVHIGNNCTIGAGTVVTKDIPDNVTVAGVPAKIISFNEPGRYIINRWVKYHD